MTDNHTSRDLQKQDTKNKILDKAEQLFLTRNFHSISTSEIAEESGVVKGTIFYHFENKDKLAIEVLNRVFNRFKVQLDELKQSHDDPELVLRTTLEEMFQMMIELPGITSLLLHFLHKIDEVDAAIQNEVQNLFEFMLGDFMAEFVDLFKQMGYSNPEIKARIVFGLIDGLGLQLHIDPRTDPQLVSELIDEIMAMITKEG